VHKNVGSSGNEKCISDDTNYCIRISCINTNIIKSITDIIYVLQIESKINKLLDIKLKTIIIIYMYM